MITGGGRVIHSLSPFPPPPPPPKDSQAAATLKNTPLKRGIGSLYIHISL